MKTILRENPGKEYSFIDLIVDICLFIIVLLIAFFIGYRAGTKNIKEKKIILQENNTNMPYIPNFGPGSGTAIFPDRGILIIKMPESVKIIVEQEGIE